MLQVALSPLFFFFDFFPFLLQDVCPTMTRYARRSSDPRFNIQYVYGDHAVEHLSAYVILSVIVKF